MDKQFEDLRFYRDYSFSIGIDTKTATPYLSIPVSNGFVDYEEYYSIPRDWAEQSDLHLPELRNFAGQCRDHKMDERLLQEPGSNRGTPV